MPLTLTPPLEIKEYFDSLCRVDLQELNSSLISNPHSYRPNDAQATEKQCTYAQDGVIVASSIFPASIIAEANKACDQLDNLAAGLAVSYSDVNVETQEGGWYSQDGSKVGYAGAIRKVQNLIDHSPVFKSMALYEPLLAEVYSLLNSQFKLHSKGFLINKPVGVSKEKPWHQDSAYFEVNSPQIITAWIPLQPVSEENGCLYAMVGSHKAGRQKHQEGEPKIATTEIDFSIVRAFPMSADSVIFMHHDTVHYSPKNNIKQSRRALLFRYAACT